MIRDGWKADLFVFWVYVNEYVIPIDESIIKASLEKKGFTSTINQNMELINRCCNPTQTYRQDSTT